MLIGQLQGKRYWQGYQTRRILRREIESELQEIRHIVTGKVRFHAFSGKPRPQGDRSTNRNGLIINRELANKKPESPAKQLIWDMKGRQKLLHQVILTLKRNEKSVGKMIGYSQDPMGSWITAEECVERL